MDVLVVDDDIATANLIARQIRDHFNVRIAHTSAEATASIVQAPPDVVLCDIHLDTSGVRLMAMVRHHFPAVRRILMTGDDAAGYRLFVESGDAHLVLQKPLRRVDLIDALTTGALSTATSSH
jgi:CheY-like chemotaxis protein